MNCSKCNALVPDDSVFCPECGQKIEAPAPAAPETPAAPVEAPVEAPAAEKAAPINVGAIMDKIKALTAKIPANYLKIGAGAVALILVIAIIASLFGGAKVYNYALYVKDGQVQYAEMPKGKDVVEVTSDFAENVGDYQLSTAGSYLAAYFQLSSDGKKLFYPDKIDDGYTLYCREINSPKKDPVKIESNLEDPYYINEKGNLVTYVKDGKLYQHNLKEKTKIASDVSDFSVSEDGKTILYSVYDEDDRSYTLYLKKGNKDAEKIVSDVTDICHVSEDLSLVVYLKEDSLYTQKVGKDAAKISGDVSEVVRVYESGEIYYTKAEDTEISYWDLIKDDYKDIDSWDYEYYSEWMKETEVDVEFATLCYYNGKESTTLSESMVRWSSVAYEEPAMVFQALEDDELPTWSLTEYINGNVDLYGELDAYLAENSLYFIAAEEVTGALELEDIYSVAMTSDAKTLYVRADYDEEDNVTSLYQLTMDGAKTKKSEKLDEDVYARRLSIVYGEKDAHVIYFKDVDDEEGELYMDGKKIDDDVYLYNISYNAEEDDLYYMIDWDADNQQGSLKYSNGKKATAVKDDVHYYVFTPEGQCLFLYDFSNSSYRGELWIQDGSKTTKLADDVSCIIPIY